MQNVSPGTGKEETDRDVAEEYKAKIHVTVTGIVNVEQKHASPEDVFSAGGKGRAGTGKQGYPSATGGAVA
jgi:hypothetical protein